MCVAPDAPPNMTPQVHSTKYGVLHALERKWIGSIASEAAIVGS